jgi:hypothetical protein
MGLLQTSRRATGHTCQATHAIDGAELGCILTEHGGGMHLDVRGLWWCAAPALALSH